MPQTPLGTKKAQTGFTHDESLRAENDRLKARLRELEEFREGVLAMLREIERSESELEAAYRKLKEAETQLMHTSKLSTLGELAAGLAHEIKQPITVIKGLSDSLLRNCEKDANLRDKVRLIHEASLRMEAIVRHLRIFSRMDDTATRPFDLNKVIKDALTITQEMFRKNGIALNLDLSPCLPRVHGSPNRLEQVVINLISNAKDAMPGGGTVEIATSTLEGEGRKSVKMSIKDSGCGMAPDVVQRVFEPFFTTKEAGKGTGLGLSISHSIIKEHNGDITVETVPGKGATFNVVLPAMDERQG